MKKLSMIIIMLAIVVGLYANAFASVDVDVDPTNVVAGKTYRTEINGQMYSISFDEQEMIAGDRSGVTLFPYVWMNSNVIAVISCDYVIYFWVGAGGTTLVQTPNATPVVFEQVPN